MFFQIYFFIKPAEELKKVEYDHQGLDKVKYLRWYNKQAKTLQEILHFAVRLLQTLSVPTGAIEDLKRR